jgi:hypothetical protein
MSKAAIAIDAPARLVYELAKDQERFPQFMPDVETVTCSNASGRGDFALEDAGRRGADRVDGGGPLRRCRAAHRLQAARGRSRQVRRRLDVRARDGLTHVVLGVDYDFGVPTLAELIGPDVGEEGAREQRDDARALKRQAEVLRGAAVNKFCFVIHPLSLEDIARYEPGAKGKGEPIVRKIMEWMPPYAAVHVTGVRTPDGRETEGWFVAAPLCPSR